MTLLAILGMAVTYLFLRGVGIWGIEMPVAWGFAIINFVWWIGIGHAGTLISAILLLFKQTWRNSINRFAEAMTLFAVACAGMFPLLHMGRPWLGYWMFPYPNSMGVWPQFRSPLVWDVFAVSTYATISAVFWFVGLVPDFALDQLRCSPERSSLVRCTRHSPPRRSRPDECIAWASSDPPRHPPWTTRLACPLPCASSVTSKGRTLSSNGDTPRAR